LGCGYVYNLCFLEFIFPLVFFYFLNYFYFNFALGGDRFDVDEATNDLLDLSIDEPQLEGVIFEEEIEDVQEIDLENIEEEC